MKKILLFVFIVAIHLAFSFGRTVLAQTTGGEGETACNPSAANAVPGTG